MTIQGLILACIVAASCPKGKELECGQTRAMLQQASEATETSVTHLAALAAIENNLQHEGCSGKNACGPLQVTPIAEKAVNRTFGTSLSRHVVEENVLIGAVYWRMMNERFLYDRSLALAAYNAGPTRVQCYLAGECSLPTETKNYIRKFNELTKQCTRT